MKSINDDVSEKDIKLVSDADEQSSRHKRKRFKPKRNLRNRRQQKRVRKQEEAKRKVEEDNKKRKRKGKSLKEDPGLWKPSIWEKMAEDRLYSQLREIGDSTQNIDKFQRKRTIFSAILLVFGLVLGMIVHKWLYLAGPIFAMLFYFMQIKKVDGFYQTWKFHRQLNFSKFTRLVIPYLKASGGNAALYTIFNKILMRTEDEADRRSLYRLMGEMGDNPTSIQPFIDYAERSSGSDMSHLFMTTIYDFQQSSFDTDVIDELGKMASEDMMEAVDEIIAFKLRRFVMFPTKVVMSSFVIVAGLGVAMMFDNFKNLDMSGNMMEINTETTESIEDVEMYDGPDSSDGDDIILPED